MIWRIRHAAPGDAEALSAAVHALSDHHQESDPAGRFTTEAARRDLFGERPRALCFVAEDGGRLLGYVFGSQTYESNWAEAGLYMSDLWVEPAARRRGIGRALVAALAAEARRGGCGYLWWASRPWNVEAHAFYARLGATAEEVRAHALIFEDFQRLAGEGDATPPAPPGSR